MNELYSIAPNACDSAREFEYVLRDFGPHAGRYLIGLPRRDSWCKSVLDAHAGLRDVAHQRLSRVLVKARESGAVIDFGTHSWSAPQSWVDNALRAWGCLRNHRKIYVAESDYEAIVDGNERAQKYVENISNLDAAAANWIDAPCDANVYWGLMEVLFSISTELHLVDPYFDPLKADRKPIFEKILRGLRDRPHIRRLVFWSRHAEVAKRYGHNGGKIDRDEILSFVRYCMKGARGGSKVLLKFVEDETSNDKFHSRFLVTNKGGVVFDQGFQVLPGRHALVSAMGSAMSASRFQKLAKSGGDIRVKEEISFGLS